jgi:hypothetical protein
MVSSVYESLLDKHSVTYARDVCLLPNYFYEALAFNVSIAGEYSFWSHSDIDTYGYLYRADFNPLQPAVDQISRNDDSCVNRQFLIAHHLLPNTTYILVVTTSYAGEASGFSIISRGSTSVQFVCLGRREHSSV